MREDKVGVYLAEMVRMGAMCLEEQGVLNQGGTGGAGAQRQRGSFGAESERARGCIDVSF
jgi:hypothetical protein